MPWTSLDLYRVWCPSGQAMEIDSSSDPAVFDADPAAASDSPGTVKEVEPFLRCLFDATLAATAVVAQPEVGKIGPLTVAPDCGDGHRRSRVRLLIE